MARAPTPDRVEYVAPFALRDQVTIDHDPSIIAVVTAVCWRSDDGCTIEVSWMHAGVIQTAWLSPWRLAPARAR